MTNQTHTQGPWIAFRRSAQTPYKQELINNWFVGDGKGILIATELTEANARLIASAPELLLAAKEAVIALRDIAKVCNVDESKIFGDGTITKKLLSIITKAEGA